ncbi:MAG: rod shape-determining protein [Patescibacteria group bacterium]
MIQLNDIPFSKNIALDWGSRFCYTWSDRKGYDTLSSQVWVNDKGEMQINVDNASKLNGRLYQVPTIKNGDITDFKLCIKFLNQLITDNLNQFELAKPNLWVAISSSAHPSEIEGLEYVLKQAGAGKVKFINQNLALAVHNNYNFGGLASQFLMHVGHQTTLLSLISPGGFVMEREVLFGGQNLDSAIQDYVRRSYRLSISPDDIEKIKKLLNPQNSRIEIWGQDLVTERIRSVELDFNEIWNQTKNLAEDLANIIKSFIHDLPPELINDLVDNGIIMSGGTASFGRLRDYLQIRLGVNVYLSLDPSTAVIRGLKRIVDNRNEYLKSRFA